MGFESVLSRPCDLSNLPPPTRRMPMEPAPTRRNGLSSAGQLTSPMRKGLAALVVLSGAILCCAARLVPDPRGYGTHEQLGMAPCWFLQKFAIPCPSCGMTTAFALAMQGEFRSATAANAGGVLLAATTIVLGSWALATAATNKWIAGRLTLERALWWATFVGLATLCDWARRLMGG